MRDAPHALWIVLFASGCIVSSQTATTPSPGRRAPQAAASPAAGGSDPIAPANPAPSSSGGSTSGTPPPVVTLPPSTGSPTPPVYLPGEPVPSVDSAVAAAAGTWRNLTPVSIDPSKTACTTFTFDPTTPSTLYAMYGDPGGGTWRSTDSGANWIALANAPSPSGLGRILVDPNDSSHLYTTAGVRSQYPDPLGFWYSHDGGASWTMPPAFTDGAAAGTWITDLYNIVADPADFNHILITSHQSWPGYTNSAGVLESTDGGVSFIAHLPPAKMGYGGGIAFLHDPTSPTGLSRNWLVGGGYEAGVMATTDSGAHWASVFDAAQDNHGGFFATYSPQGFLYIGLFNGVGRSTDNGASWSFVGQGTLGQVYYYGVVSDGQALYAAEAFVGNTYNPPLLKTSEGGVDEGATWTVTNDRQIAEGPYKMVFEPAAHSIYAARWGSGAWAYDVGQ